MLKESYPSITIGTFDGVHLGHQSVLNALKIQKRKRAILTFRAPPSPDKKCLITLAHKLLLLEKFGTVILLDFAKIKNLPFEGFLQSLLDKFSFNMLVLGKSSTLGYQKKGDEKALQLFAKKKNFSITFIEPVLYQNRLISSSWIRDAVKTSNFPLAKALLGRPYSLYMEKDGKFTNIVLPKEGCYEVMIKKNKSTFLTKALLEGSILTLEKKTSFPFFVEFQQKVTP